MSRPFLGALLLAALSVVPSAFAIRTSDGGRGTFRIHVYSARPLVSATVLGNDQSCGPRPTGPAAFPLEMAGAPTEWDGVRTVVAGRDRVCLETVDGVFRAATLPRVTGKTEKPDLFLIAEGDRLTWFQVPARKPPALYFPPEFGDCRKAASPYFCLESRKEQGADGRAICESMSELTTDPERYLCFDLFGLKDRPPESIPELISLLRRPTLRSEERPRVRAQLARRVRVPLQIVFFLLFVAAPLGLYVNFIEAPGKRATAGRQAAEFGLGILMPCAAGLALYWLNRAADPAIGVKDLLIDMRIAGLIVVFYFGSAAWLFARRRKAMGAGILLTLALALAGLSALLGGISAAH